MVMDKMHARARCDRSDMGELLLTCRLFSKGTPCNADTSTYRGSVPRGWSAARRNGAGLSHRLRCDPAAARTLDDFLRQVRGERVPGMRPHGVQRMVYILQELEEDGQAHYSVCCQAVVPGGVSRTLTLCIEY